VLAVHRHRAKNVWATLGATGEPNRASGRFLSLIAHGRPKACQNPRPSPIPVSWEREIVQLSGTVVGH
jgi:hypothetical protein